MPNEKILIVEDDPAALQLMTDMLRHASYQVISAKDGVQGLAMAKKEQPDLILMDIQLPGMNGLVVAQKIKADPAIAWIPIAAVTSMELDRKEYAAMVRDCVGYIPKPISPRTVLGLVPAFLQIGKRRKAGA